MFIRLFMDPCANVKGSSSCKQVRAYLLAFFNYAIPEVVSTGGEVLEGVPDHFLNRLLGTGDELLRK